MTLSPDVLFQAGLRRGKLCLKAVLPFNQFAELLPDGSFAELKLSQSGQLSSFSR